MTRKPSVSELIDSYKFTIDRERIQRALDSDLSESELEQELESARRLPFARPFAANYTRIKVGRLVLKQHKLSVARSVVLLAARFDVPDKTATRVCDGGQGTAINEAAKAIFTKMKRQERDALFKELRQLRPPIM